MYNLESLCLMYVQHSKYECFPLFFTIIVNRLCIRIKSLLINSEKKTTKLTTRTAHLSIFHLPHRMRYEVNCDATQQIELQTNYCY